MRSWRLSKMEMRGQQDTWKSHGQHRWCFWWCICWWVTKRWEPTSSNRTTRVEFQPLVRLWPSRVEACRVFPVGKDPFSCGLSWSFHVKALHDSSLAITGPERRIPEDVGQPNQGEFWYDLTIRYRRVDCSLCHSGIDKSAFALKNS